MINYRNISSGVIPIPGRGEVQPNKTISLSDDEILMPEVAAYIGKYLSPILTTLAKPPIPLKPVTPTVSGTTIESGRQGTLVKPPKDKTEEELEAEKQKQEDEETVAVKRAKRVKDAVVQTIQEVTRGKIRYANEKLKSLVSWQQKVRYVESIDNAALLEILIPKLTGKVQESAKKTMKKLLRRKA